ncbi:hypothetical protein Q7P37_007649 [Cladosporium fusiforme]
MDQGVPLAIVGYSYRAPNVGGKGLWEFLSEAKSAWSPVPADRFNQDAFYHPKHEKAGTFSSKGAHFLPGNVYAFDAPFFNLRADEARAMDPQQRMLLECAFEAAENAGIPLVNLAGSKVGVFAANESLDYGDQTTQDPPSMNQYTGIGMAPCMFANRLSYFFDLKGPSISVDAACASSSYALHMAAKSVQSGECDAAFIGGAHLILSPTPWIILDNAGMLSPDGRSYSYDTRANGFGRGEGAACLLVKRLADAVKDGDSIRAIIRNTAASHSGRTNGITMPSQSAQVQLLTRLHQEVGLDPRDTGYVEGHGTGTQVGDPIDAGSIATVFGPSRTAANPVYIGALKSNFGHTEGASGVLGVVKTVMMLEKGIILPNANFEQMSSKIIGRETLSVVKTPTPWPPGKLRRACATNFGFGGANAAVVLEASTPESIASLLAVNGVVANTRNLAAGTDISVSGASSDAASRRNETPDPRFQLFVFSAKSDASLGTYLASFVKYLETQHDYGNRLGDLSFTLGQHRNHFTHRHAIASGSLEELKSKLSSTKSVSGRVIRARDPTVGFVFTGQGAQYARMIADLHHVFPFTAALRRADDIIRKLGASWSLLDELEKFKDQSRVHDVEIAQPACTAVQLALVAVIRDAWKVTPSIVGGHSSGEIAAAFAAGHISFEAALAIAYFRGQAAAKIQEKSSTQGAMLALGVGREGADELILSIGAVGYAVVAAINSPGSTTVSGDLKAVEAVHKAAEAKGIFARRLNIAVAYHSRHMSPVAETYGQAIAPYLDDESGESCAQSTLFVSSVTGQIESRDVIQDPTYWVRNLLSPVRFSEAIEQMCYSDGHDRKHPDVIVEIGPHSALKTPIQQTVAQVSESGVNQKQISYLPSLVRGAVLPQTLLELAGGLFTAGFSLDLAGVNQYNSSTAKRIPDLPGYEWNRNTTFIHRARVPAERLSNKLPFNPLLGWKSPYTEGNETSFRNVFTLDDLPWIRGHNIGGEVLFPLTGFMSLAIEAIRTLLSASKPTTIRLTEFHAKRSLKIEEEERIDITTKLRPSSTGTEQFSSSIWSFEILTWSESGGWSTHCYGKAEANNHDLNMESKAFRSAVDTIKRGDLNDLDPEHEYAMADEVGTVYGPEYRTMDVLRQAPGIVVHEIKLRELDALIASSTYGSPVTVDPPTLDSLFHALSVIQETEERGLFVPTYFTAARISNNIPAAPGQRFTIVSRRLQLEPKSGTLRMSFVVYTTTDGSMTPIFEMENLTLKCIRQSATTSSEASLPDGFRNDLVPHLDLIDGDYLADTLVKSDVPECDLLFQRQVESVSLHLMGKAIEETAQDDTNKWPPFMKKARDWAARLNPIVLREDEATKLINVVSKHSTPGKLSCEVGKQFTKILRGEVKPLELMLNDGLLSKHYEEDLHTKRGSSSLARLIRVLAAMSPNMRVLEIGAGTGGTTMKVLQALTCEDEDEEAQRSWSYTYTDISSGFFENARVKFSQWSKRITYQKLDVGQDPFSQGFQAESFDLIVAANVLHATPNMEVTMNNVCSLLKPRGTLALLEVVVHSPVAMPFAVLPGWWLSEDKYRGPDGPLMTKPVWDQLLLDTGFDGVRGYLSEYPERERLMAAMWSRKASASEKSTSPQKNLVTIVGPLVTSQERKFAQLVAEEMARQFQCTSSIKPVSEVEDIDESSWYVFLDSPEQSFFASMTERDFEVLQDIVLESAGILWVRPEGGQPETGFAKAMLTTVRHEDSARKLFHLETTPYTPAGASCIAKVTKQVCDPAADLLEQEYACKDGVVHVPRLRLLKSAKQAFAMDSGLTVKTSQNIWKDTNVAPVELTVEAPGSLDSIYFRRSNVYESQPGEDDQIVVRVTAAGVNFRDLLLVLGSLPWMPPGFEGVGTVVQTGSNVKHVQTGDKVVFITKQGGAFATHVRVLGMHAWKLPHGADEIGFAGFAIAYLTAYIAVMRLGQLKQGESILIHAATGAVGQACVAMAKLQGASDIYVTAGTDEKRALLQQKFAIPESNIFNSRNDEFKEGISEATDGKGVDVVINSLSGELLQHTWTLVADFGRFVEIGKADILLNNSLSMRTFDRSTTFASLDALRHLEQRPREAQQYLTEIIRLIDSGTLPFVSPTTRLPVSDIHVAFRKLQSGQNIGKLVVTLDENAVVQAECVSRLSLDKGSQTLLSANETYLITGGTGGIGRELAVWMFENGARNVVLLGRSGSSNAQVAELVKHHEGTDFQLRAIACDVASKPQLESALRNIQDLPKVKGVIHGALYLRDAMFANATFDDWQKITGPKIQAAWHLHHLLPELKFFVALGSVEALTGNLGQSIYSGTSTFMDAFANYRTSLNLPATSVHLPVVEDVGYVAKLGIFESMRESLGLTISPAQLRLIVKAAIMGPDAGLSSSDQITCFVRSTVPAAEPEEPWERFRALWAMRRRRQVEDGSRAANGADGSAKSSGQPANVLDALRNKVATITLMEEEEVTPDRPLQDYGLDSLVSVELRNWIRRELGVDMALTQIARAKDLQELGNSILKGISTVT